MPVVYPVRLIGCNPENALHGEVVQVFQATISKNVVILNSEINSEAFSLTKPIPCASRYFAGFHFNALPASWHRPEWSLEENLEFFGVCANPNYHGIQL